MPKEYICIQMGTKPVVIENPILNSAFKEPSLHFKFSDDGITNEIVEDRRVSSYFIPIAKPKKRGRECKQLRSKPSGRRTASRRTPSLTKSAPVWPNGDLADIRASPKPRLSSWIIGKTQPENGSFSSARSRPSKPSSTSPKSPQSMEIHGLKISSRTSTRTPTRCFTASPSKWPLAAEKRWSWPCSSPGMS